MAARAGMVSLIATLRGMTETAENDTTIGSLTFWTDDQLQSILDRHSFYVSEQLESFPEIEAGSYTYKKYFLPQLPHPYFEGSATTGAFKDRKSVV